MNTSGNTVGTTGTASTTNSIEKRPALIARMCYRGFVFRRDVIEKQLGRSGLDKILNKLTLRRHDKRLDREFVRRVYEEFNIGGVEYLALPRGLYNAFAKMGYRISADFPRTAHNFRARFSIKLFPSQEVVRDHFLKNIYTDAARASGSASAILEMRAGMGKTMTAAAIIAGLGVRTLWITKISALALQALDDLQLSFGCGLNDSEKKLPIWKTRAASVGIRIYDSKPPKSDPFGDWRTHDITIMLIHTACKMTPEFFALYDFIIFDEVHEYVGEKFAGVFSVAQRPYMLGMSATIRDNEKGYDQMYKYHLGRIVESEKLPGFTFDDVEFNSIVRVIHYHGPESHTKHLTHESTGELFVNYMYKQFSEDKYRVRLIVEEMRRLYANPDNNIYVFANEISTLRILSDEFTKAGLDSAMESNMDFLIGETGKSSERVMNIRKNIRVVLTTYGYAGTGVSIDKMNVIIFAEPRKAKIKQILARALRRTGNLEIAREFIDIVDEKTCLRHQYAKREIGYEAYNMKIKHYRCDYDDIDGYLKKQ